MAPDDPIWKLYKLNIHEFNKNISNESKHVEKVKFVPKELPIFQPLTIIDYKTW